MSINSVYTAASINANAVALRVKLAGIRAIAADLSSGTRNLAQIMSALRTLDVFYGEAVPLWDALAGTRSAAEATAVANIQTALDDLLIAFADAMTIPVSAVVDLGAGYGGTRAQKLAALNRAFPYKGIAIPASITGPAGALVAAVDAFAAA